MAFSLSPSVEVREFDLSLTIPNLPSARTGMVVRADSGPCNKIVSVTTETDLINNFGKPTAENYMDWFQAWNFLQYASSLYLVRPLPKFGATPAPCQNAGVGLSGSGQVLTSSANLYNDTVADNVIFPDTLQGEIDNLTAERMYIFNRYVAKTQDLAVAVCSNSYFWNSPIASDLKAFVAISGTTGQTVVTATTTNGKAVSQLTTSDLSTASDDMTLTVGSQFLTKETVPKLITVTGFTDNNSGIILDNEITSAMIDNFSASVSGANVGAGTLALTVPSNVFKGAMFTKETLATIGVSALKDMTVYNVTDTTLSLRDFDTLVASGSFASATVTAGNISGNATAFYGTVSTESISAGNYKVGRTIKMNPGFTFTPGSMLSLTNNGSNKFTVDDIDTTNNVLYLSDAITGTIAVPVSPSAGLYYADETVLPKIVAVNKLDLTFDDGLIKRERITVQTKPGTGAWANDVYYKQTLVSFSDLYDFVPDFVAGEFFVAVLKMNQFDKYQLVETELVSYLNNGKDEQGRNIFADKVFFDSSKYIYVKTNSVKSKVNTADTGLAKLGTSTAGSISYVFSEITRGDVQDAAVLFGDAETFDVNILVANQLDINGMSEIAESRKDCITIVAPYEYASLVKKSASDASSYLCELYGTQTQSSAKVFTRFGTYTAVYGNMKYQYDKFNDVNRWMCLAGDIAGLYAATDANRDPWWAPAGLERGKMKNVIKLALNPNKQNRDDLYVNSINPIINIVGEGAGVVFGQKTATAKPSAFDRVNVRRLLVTIEKAIASASRYSLFEFNDVFTRNRLKGMIEPFLRSVKARRGLYDYMVVIDDTNNTAEVIDKNALVIDIYLKPTKVAEFIQINAFVTRTDANFQEIVGKA